MSDKFLLEDVAKSYKWLGHKGFTELNAFHPKYKPGRDNFEWNKEHKTFPCIAYANNERDVINFVKRYSQTYMVCYSINPRFSAFTNQRGYPRAAHEEEIEISQNLLLDFDFYSNKPLDEQINDFKLLLKKAYQYFKDLGTSLPSTAFTGRGYHLLFPYPAIKVDECLDIAYRLRAFCDQFRQAHREDLERLKVRLDPTQDLRRMLKIYGTAKPEIGVVSRFYGGERVDDEALRAYLLKMNIERAYQSSVLVAGKELPLWFHKLIGDDEKIRALWNGQGKPDGLDKSKSGYDFSLVKTLMRKGYKNLDNLATILWHRPLGGVTHEGKGEDYIARTIAKALLR